MAETRKILIIEDDPVLRQLVVKALRMTGFETIEAENGKAGVQLASVYLPDLILSDIKMEGFDGFAALAALRYQPRTEGIPVVLMTGNPDEKGRQFAMKLGAADYITKPFTIPSLVAAIKAQIKESGPAVPAVLDDAFVDRTLEFAAETAPEMELSSQRDLIVTSGLAAPPDTAECAVAKFPGAAGLGSASALETESIDEVESVVAAQLRMLNRFHCNLGNTAVRAVVVCRAQAEVAGLSPDDTRTLCWAAALHDISLIGLDQEAVGRWLRDPRKVTEEEHAFIRNHPIESQLMMEDVPALKIAGQIIRSHHENWDGTGYPDRLEHEQIHPLARHLAIAVCYCSHHSLDVRAIRILESAGGSIFDPKAVEVLVEAAAIAKVPPGIREILLNEMKPGQILARDIRNSMGVALARKERDLTDLLIQKLNSVNRVSPFGQHVLVYT